MQASIEEIATAGLEEGQAGKSQGSDSETESEDEEEEGEGMVLLLPLPLSPSLVPMPSQRSCL